MVFQELEHDPKSKHTVTLGLLADVTGTWQVEDEKAILSLTDHHIWSEKFVRDRLYWRPKVPFTVLELRVKRLSEPISLPNSDSYWGCFSFVDIPCDGRISLDTLSADATPVLDDVEFDERQHAIRRLLEGQSPTW